MSGWVGDRPSTGGFTAWWILVYVDWSCIGSIIRGWRSQVAGRGIYWWETYRDLLSDRRVIVTTKQPVVIISYRASLTTPIVLICCSSPSDTQTKRGSRAEPVCEREQDGGERE